MLFHRLLSLFFILIFFISNAQDEESILPLQKNIYVFTDSSNSYSAKEAYLADAKYTLFNEGVPSLGVSNYTHWVKVIYENDVTQNLFLYIDYPTIDEIIYYPNAFNSNFDEKQIISERKKFRQRIYNHQIPVFSINQNVKQTYFFEIKSAEQILLPIKIDREKNVFNDLDIKDFFSGIYFGIMMVMILYNFFIYLTVKDKVYIYYVLYVIFVALTQSTLLGYTFRFLAPNHPDLAIYSIYIFGALVGIFTFEFFKKYLNIKKHFIRIYYLSCFIQFCYFLAIVVVFFGYFTLSYKIIDACAGIGAIIILGAAIYANQKGVREAKFFLIAWSSFLVSVIVFVLRNSGVLPFNNFTNYALLIGSSIEVILLSFALADRINLLKKEKADAQKRELEVLQENQSLVENRNIELQKMVGERTKDLQKTNDELNATLTKLQKAQVQLVESEKMVSLGQLTAGVAHEINNPINFVLSNVTPLRRDLDDLLEIITEYEVVKSNPEQGFSKVDSLKKSLDFDYLKEEIKQILEGIENGAERTSEIVKSLRMFSRLDESDQKKAKINDCLESTLTVLTSKIKDFSVRVNKDYQFKEEINCFPGKLNQVFMNIINNSLDALENKSGPELSISIKKIDDWLEVAISDNGTGMPEKVKAHIFDPFFTTKEVGKGTGLGMSIVYSIIQDHHGKITVVSEEGIGTTFQILLPITD